MNSTSVDIRPLIESIYGPSSIKNVGNTVAFMPSNTSETLQAVDLALKHGFGICPSGTGSHINSGSMRNDILVVATDNLCGVIEYAPDDLFIIVEAGMKLSDVARYISDSHLCLPFSTCGYSGSVGGAVAMGIEIDIKGDRQNIRQVVTAIEFVTPYGKLINSGALTIKSVAGYDIARFLVGSKGCFGIITSVALRLKPNPKISDAKPKLVSTTQRISPRWDRPAAGEESTPVEYLKQNLDPNEIFPMP